MKENLQNQLFYLLFIFSLIISLYFGENSSGGSEIDHIITKSYIDDFNIGFFHGIKSFIENGQIQSPIFYYLISILQKIFIPEFLSIIYVFISSTLPLIFYKILKIKFNTVNKKYIFFLSLVIFLSPYYRSSSSWITNDNLSLIFFCISIFYFLKFKQNQIKSNLEIYLCFIFLSLSAYIRQYYGLFFIIYLIELIKIKNKSLILKCLMLNFFLLIPFLIYMFFFIKYHGEIVRTTNPTGNSFFENIPYVLSIIFFYFFIFLLSTKLEYLSIKNQLNKNFKTIIIIISFYTIFLLLLSTEHYEFGGGIIYKLGSFLNLGIFFIYFFSSISIILILLIIYKNMSNYLIILIFFMISSQLVYQKYYDPLVFIIFFTLIESKKIELVIKKNLLNIKKLFFIKFIFLIVCNLYYISN